jgi:DNA polymerase-3 subunit alpha
MDLIPDFIKRRHGEVKIEYEHPLLEPISRETYGVLIYQEQVMQAAQLLAGYTLGGADLLRRAMGKKKVEEMQKQRETFVKGAEQVNKIPASKANQVFDLLEKFAGYGFNKSHAAAYAIVAYQTAYLKANYPVEFLSAMLTNDMNDTAKLSILVQEAKIFGVEVLGPDVNESKVVFAPARNGTVIRFGLAAIKGVGEIAVKSILDARNSGGHFSTLDDLCERVDGRTVSRKVLEALIKSGACDTFGETRASMFANIDRSMTRAASIVQDRQRGQSSMFGMMEEPKTLKAENIRKIPEWPETERWAAEKELLGFYVTGHPINPYLPLLDKFALTNTDGAAKLPNRSMTRIGGIISAVQSGISKKSNKPYAMVTIEDLQGTIQILVMNENHDKYSSILQPGKAILVVGEVNNGEDKPKIFPQEIMMLEDAPAKYTKQVHLRLNSSRLEPERLDGLKAITASNPGRCPLFLCFIQPGGKLVYVEAHEKFGVAPSRKLQESIDELLGRDVYYAKVDASLPERAPKKWEKRTSNGGDDE